MSIKGLLLRLSTIFRRPYTSGISAGLTRRATRGALWHACHTIARELVGSCIVFTGGLEGMWR